jgi:hypothetical protein
MRTSKKTKDNSGHLLATQLAFRSRRLDARKKRTATGKDQINAEAAGE